VPLPFDGSGPKSTPAKAAPSAPAGKKAAAAGKGDGGKGPANKLKQKK